MAKNTLAKVAIAAALMGDGFPELLTRGRGFSIGVSSAKPSDMERARKAEERRTRRQAKRPNARIYPV